LIHFAYYNDLPQKSQSVIGQIDDFRRGFLGKKAQKAGKKGGMVIKKFDSIFKKTNFTNREVGCIVEA